MKARIIRNHMEKLKAAAEAHAASVRIYLQTMHS